MLFNGWDPEVGIRRNCARGLWPQMVLRLRAQFLPIIWTDLGQ